MSASDVVEITGVVKRFGDFTAIHDASLTVRKGEVHAIVGENGAGKSTLMNILYGLLHRDAGEVKLFQESVNFSGPAEAIAAGVGMVHQHFKLAPTFTVADNIILGSEPMRSLGRLDRERAIRETGEISKS